MPTDLSRDAWLNIEADLAAKNCIMDLTQEANYEKLPF